MKLTDKQLMDLKYAVSKVPHSYSIDRSWAEYYITRAIDAGIVTLAGTEDALASRAMDQCACPGPNHKVSCEWGRVGPK